MWVLEWLEQRKKTQSVNFLIKNIIIYIVEVSKVVFSEKNATLFSARIAVRIKTKSGQAMLEKVSAPA